MLLGKTLKTKLLVFSVAKCKGYTAMEHVMNLL